MNQLKKKNRKKNEIHITDQMEMIVPTSFLSKTLMKNTYHLESYYCKIETSIGQRQLNQIYSQDKYYKYFTD